MVYVCYCLKEVQCSL